VDVAGLGGVVGLAAGGTHTCALTTGGGLLCWGAHTYGQIGDGTPVAIWNYPLNVIRPVPTPVLGLAAGVAQVSAGSEHTCAVTVGGSVKCWGSDGLGQLGLNALPYRAAPGRVLSAIIDLNYVTGRSGSTLTLTGLDFAPDAWVYLTVSGRTLLPAVRTNPTGGFVAFLDTQQVQDGDYALAASVAAEGDLGFALEATAPLRAQEGGGTVLHLAQGVFLAEIIYLPVLGKSAAAPP
jgi:hypothetical protein